jgi:hypothetical protein
MKSSFNTLGYIADQSISLSQISTLKTSFKNDVEDSETVLISSALAGGSVSSESECTTGSSVSGLSGDKSILPLFSAFFTEVQGRNTSGFALAHGAGYEIRRSQDGKSGEIWRVTCDAVVDLATSQTSWKPNILSSTRLAQGLAVPFESGSSIVSKWYENNFSSGLYGLACITFDKPSQKYVPSPCQYGVEYARSSGQSQNGVRGLVLRVWKSNGDLSDDIVAARRLT